VDWVRKYPSPKRIGHYDCRVEKSGKPAFLTFEILRLGCFGLVESLFTPSQPLKFKRLKVRKAGLPPLFLTQVPSDSIVQLAEQGQLPAVMVSSNERTPTLKSSDSTGNTRRYPT
jgi:hypothetical protein